MCILVKFLNVLKEFILEKFRENVTLTKNILCTELCPNDVLWMRNVCHLLNLKPSESLT